VARPQVADLGTPANVLNKQPRANDKGWFSSFGVGHGANNLSL
jgi:hypothetical protein